MMKENMKREKEEKVLFSLEQYLAGRQPLKPEWTAMPTDEELEAAEAEFDRIVTERQEAKPPVKVTRRIPLRAWVKLLSAAAVLALVFLLWPKGSAPEGLPSLSSSMERPDEPSASSERHTALLAATDKTAEGSSESAGASEASERRTSRAATSQRIRESIDADTAGRAKTPGAPGEEENLIEETLPDSETEDLLARTARADEEVQTRIEAIDAIAQAQADLAYGSAVAAVLCSREPS